MKRQTSGRYIQKTRLKRSKYQSPPRRGPQRDARHQKDLLPSSHDVFTGEESLFPRGSSKPAKQFTPRISGNFEDEDVVEWIGKSTTMVLKASQETIKLYDGCSINGTSYLIGDIIKLDKKQFGDIVHLFEKDGAKMAEIRRIEKQGTVYVETWHYEDIHLHTIPRKVEGVKCTKLHENGVLKNVEDSNKFQRSRSRSKLAIKMNSDASDHLNAIASLTLTSVPSKLVCREKETTELMEFLEDSIRNGGSTSSLYMCGMPGLGKTATFLYVIDKLQQRLNFEFIFINCMKLSKPTDIYSILAETILGKAASRPATALKSLQNHFVSKKKKGVYVILVDELDALLNKKQDIIYNLYNWTSTAKAGLVVTGIANTMDLPERFQAKISSRHGHKRIIFPPYRREELQTILKKRLDDISLFTDDAITFACGKVASYSGDARKTFQICKRAARISQQEQCRVVSIDHVRVAFNQLFSSHFQNAIQSASKFQKFLLICLCLELKMNSLEYAKIENLFQRQINLSAHINEDPLKLREVKEIAARLCSVRICIPEGDNIKLNVYADEVCHALEDDPLFRKFNTMF